MLKLGPGKKLQNVEDNLSFLGDILVARNLLLMIQ